MRSSARRNPQLDTQTTEILGRQYLTADLLRAGLEVAEPTRDRGVDLIAYADIDKQLGRFVARPIQMKAATGRFFGIWKKYERFNDLLVAFVWHLDAREPVRTYALTCKEALEIGVAMRWTRTNSWRKAGVYVTSRPSEKLMHLLDPHLMVGEGWWGKVTSGDRRVRNGRR